MRAAGPILVALLSAHALAAAAYAQDAEAIESQLKTEFIERFTQFIEWAEDVERPEGGAPAGSFVLGVYGSDPLARNLRDLARRQRIRGRQAEFVEIDQLEQVDDCHLVFIAGSEERNLAAILQRTSGRPILTIGDTRGFGRDGVLINFVRQGDRLRFEINAPAVEKSRLRFSSRLLRLASLIEADGG